MLSKDALLGASDLIEREIDLPSVGGSVRVRSLPAAYSNQAQTEALEVTQVRGEAVARVNVAKLEALQVLHGLIEPKLDTVEEAEALARKLGPAWARIIETIDEISGVDKEAIVDAEVRFQPGGQSEAGQVTVDAARSGNGRSDLPARAGVGAGDASRGNV